MRNAFSMVELVFVIAIIGILSAIAVPKFAATRDDALATRASTTVAALRSAISTERQKRILKGIFASVTATEAVALLEYPLTKDWAVSGNTFIFTDGSGSTCNFVLGSDNRLVKDTCAVAGLQNL